MDEKYGIKMTLDISEFKSKLNRVSDLVNKTGKKIQEDLSVSSKLPNTAFKFSFPETEHYSFKEYNSILNLQKGNKLKSLKVDFDGISKSMSIFKQNIYDGSLALNSMDNNVRQLQSDMDGIQTKNFTPKFFEIMGNGNSLKAYRNNFTNATFSIQQNKKEIKDLANTTENESKRIKASSDIIREAFKERLNIRVDNRSSQAQIRQLQSEIYNIEKTLKSDLELPVKYRMSETERINLEADLEKVKNKLYELQNVSKDTGNKLGISLNNGIEKGYKSIKKLTIGFLGARTAFSLFRNQLSNYRAENEQFNASMTLTTDIITQTLAPAFEWFGNALQYTFIGLARIIELMFNVNILSKVTANGLKKASDSAKELNDNLTGLDEITNLSGDSGALGTGITAQLNALDEFQKKIAEVNKWLKDTGLDKFFPKLGQGIKDVWNWVSAHPFETLLGIGAFMTLKGLLPSVLGVSGGTTGLFGIATVLTIISAVNISKIIDAWNELNEKTKQNEKEAEKLASDWQNLGEHADEFATKLTGKNVDSAFTSFSSNAINAINNVMKKLDDLNEYGWASKNISWNVWHGDYETDIKLLDVYIEELETQLKTMQSLYNQGKLNEIQEEEYKQTLLKTKDALEKAGLEGYDYEKTLKNINQQLDNLGVKQPEATIKINADTSKAKNEINNLWDAFKYAGNNIWQSISGTASNLFSAFKADGGIFANGSWHDITAYAGGGLPSMGQMFIAKEKGPELVGTINGNTAVMNNNQIVSSVASGVAQAVASVLGDNSNDRPIVLNINGKAFARATYSDYQAESRRVGTNTSIRRY